MHMQRFRKRWRTLQWWPAEDEGMERQWALAGITISHAPPSVEEDWVSTPVTRPTPAKRQKTTGEVSTPSPSSSASTAEKAEKATSSSSSTSSAQWSPPRPTLTLRDLTCEARAAELLAKEEAGSDSDSEAQQRMA